MMQRTFLVVAAMLAIAACAIEPTKPLDQQLAEAKNPTEHKEALLTACLSEAEWPSIKSKRTHAGSQIRHGSHDPSASEVRSMKALCTQMDAATDKKALADTCAEAVAVKVQKKREGGADHAARTQQICEQMTGLNLNGK